MSEEKINDYFNNYYIKPFHGFELIYQAKYINKIYNSLINILGKGYSNFDRSNLTFCSTYDQIKLIDIFYKSINMNIDINKLIADGTINVEVMDENDMDRKEKYKYPHGYCTPMENNNYDVYTITGSYVFDSIVLAHELGHYAHKKYDKNDDSIFFGEAISLYAELLYEDYLKKLGFDKDAEVMRNARLSVFDNLCVDYPIMTEFADVVGKCGNLNEENYKKYYNGDYEKNLSMLDRDSFDCYQFGYRYPVGLYIAIIMRKRFLEDKSYSDKINWYLNNSDRLSFKETLQVLDINLDDERCLEEYNSYIEEYNNEINNSKSL